MARLTRSSTVKIVLIVLLCLIICGTLTGGFAFIHSAMNRWGNSWEQRNQSWVAGADASTGSFSVDAATVNGIDINWLAGKVTLDVVDDSQTGGQIQVKETEDARLPLRWRNAGGVLEVDYGDVRGLTSCAFYYNKSKDLEILVPKSIADKIESLVLDAASGNYHFNGLTCAAVTVNLASGDVRFDDFSAREATFEIASGHAIYDGVVTEKLTVDQASGDAQFSLTGSNPAFSNLSLASGEIRLMLPVPDFRVELSKMSGNFSSDFDLVSNGNTFYCYPDGSHEGKGDHGAEGSREIGQSQIEMDMMSGLFHIGKQEG